MSTKCIRCGYIRLPTDSAPDYECPKCGVVYAKAEAAHEERLRKSWGSKQKMTVIPAALAIPVVSKGGDQVATNDEAEPLPVEAITASDVREESRHNGLIALDCTKCGAHLEIDEGASTYTCKYCKTVHERDYSKGASPTPHSLRIMAERSIANSEYGKAIQFIEQGLAIDPNNAELLVLEAKARNGLASLVSGSAEAEHYRVQAQFILIQLQANRKVYGSNSALTGADPANIDLGLQYIDRCLELFPDSPVYLNLKALLLWGGKGNREAAAALLQKAAAISPRDINIQNNLKALRSSSCYIATAAFGTPFALEVNVLRTWRDQYLLESSIGRCLVTAYYRISPPLARIIEKRPFLKWLTRALLRPLVKRLAYRYSSK